MWNFGASVSLSLLVRASTLLAERGMSSSIRTGEAATGDVKRMFYFGCHETNKVYTSMHDAIHIILVCVRFSVQTSPFRYLFSEYEYLRSQNRVFRYHVLLIVGKNSFFFHIINS